QAGVGEPLQPGGQVEGRGVREAAVRVGEGEAPHLLGGRLRQLGAAVTEVHVPEPGEPVEIAASLRVLDVDAVPADEDGQAPAVVRVGQGMEIIGVQIRMHDRGSRRHAVPPRFRRRAASRRDAARNEPAGPLSGCQGHGGSRGWKVLRGSSRRLSPSWIESTGSAGRAGEASMRYMVIETFTQGPGPVYARA